MSRQLHSPSTEQGGGCLEEPPERPRGGPGDPQPRADSGAAAAGGFLAPRPGQERRGREPAAPPRRGSLSPPSAPPKNQHNKSPTAGGERRRGEKLT